MIAEMPYPWWKRTMMRLVPTFRREVEAQEERAAHVEAVRLRSIALRIHAEDLIADYRKAGKASRR